MKTELLSAHIDKELNTVVAIVESGVYVYRYPIKKPDKLLKRLSKVQKIDLKHWVLEMKNG